MLSPPKKDVLSDADAFHFEIAILFGYGNQAEIGGASSDVADQDDIAATDLVSPIAAGLRCPGIKCRLRLFEQDHFAETGRFGGSRGQIPRDFVEGRRNGKHDLTFSKIPRVALRGFGVQELLPSCVRDSGANIRMRKASAP